MKYQFLILFFMIISCKKKDNDTYTKEILLERQNISIKLKVDSQFDIYNKVFKQSDCGCSCEAIKYRFSNSNYDNQPKRDTIPYLDNIKRTGFYKDYSFTISHNACSNNLNLENQNSTNFNFEKELEKYVYLLKEEQSDIKFIIDEKKIIDNRFFRVIAYKTVNENEVYKAYTIVNGILIEFDGYQIDSEKENLVNSKFLKQIDNILNSIEIKKL